MSIKLSNRLLAVSSYIYPKCNVADIGTDHGFIPVYLAENNFEGHIIASDLRELPLQNAKKSAELHHVVSRISFRLSYGLEGIPMDECDTFIMAGMGGNTIRDILSSSPWAQSKHLILQPQTQIGELRNWLYFHGIEVKRACIAEDFGRFYVIWDCAPGENLSKPDAFDSICDPKIIENNDPLLVPFLENMKKKYIHILNGIKKSDSTTSQELKDVLSIIEKADKIIAKI